MSKCKNYEAIRDKAIADIRAHTKWMDEQHRAAKVAYKINKAVREANGNH